MRKLISEYVQVLGRELKYDRNAPTRVIRTGRGGGKPLLTVSVKQYVGVKGGVLVFGADDERYADVYYANETGAPLPAGKMAVAKNHRPFELSMDNLKLVPITKPKLGRISKADRIPAKRTAVTREDRTAIWNLRDSEPNLTHAQIGERVGRPQSTVSRVLRNARTKPRKPSGSVAVSKAALSREDAIARAIERIKDLPVKAQFDALLEIRETHEAVEAALVAHISGLLVRRTA
jgi:hypothetical protein